MARLQAVSKLLYYPTLEHIAETIKTYLAPSDSFLRIADPCCGTGAALKQIADLFPSTETIGVELSYSRAEEAEKVLDKVLPTSFYELTPSRWTPNSVSLGFNNPPYDWSQYTETEVVKGKSKQNRLRHEPLFIERLTTKIMPGGTQIIIIPEGVMDGELTLVGRSNVDRVKQHLSHWYQRLQVVRYPEPEYSVFHQVVIFAVGKFEKEKVDGLVWPAVENWHAGVQDIVLPPSPPQFSFNYHPINPEVLVRAANQCSPVGSEEWIKKTTITPLGAPFMPAMPLGIGHISMLLTSQQSGVLQLKDMLILGQSKKIQEEVGIARMNEKGKVTHWSVRAVEKHIAQLTVLHKDGTLDRLVDAGKVVDFITRNVEAIADAILYKNQPLYNFHYTPVEWEVVSKSALGLPPLPGRPERGLFPIQKHFAIASARVMKKHAQAIINAEMGTGKTSIAIAALELLGEWPILVMCPGQMVRKWRRDMKLASDPADPIVSRMITRPCVGEAQSWITYQQQFAQFGQVVNTFKFQVESETVNDPGTRRQVELKLGPRFVEFRNWVFKEFVYKDKVKTIAPTLTKKGENYVVEYVDRDDYTLFDFVSDYRSGRLGKKAAAVIAFDPAKFDAGINLSSPAHFLERPIKNEHGVWKKEKVRICPGCGRPTTAERFCLNEFADKILVNGEVAQRVRVCNTPLFEMSRWRRVGLSRIIQQKFRHFFKVYVIDECFPGNTLISTPNGQISIEDIRVGNKVFTENDGIIVTRKVTRIIRNERNGQLLKIIHSEGELICTPNHKIYVNGEFIRAERLQIGDELTQKEMPNLPKRIFSKKSYPTHLFYKMWYLVSGSKGNKRTAQEKRRYFAQRTYYFDLSSMWQKVSQSHAQEGSCVLFSEVSGVGQRKVEQRLDTRSELAKTIFGKNETDQLEYGSQNKRTNECQETGQDILWRSGRQWASNDSTREVSAGIGLENGSCNPFEQPSLAFTSSGSSRSYRKDSHRSGWSFSYYSKTKNSGSQESRNADRIGLASDPLLEFSGRPRLRKVCVLCVEPIESTEEYVYNLEVEDTHRYFANGILVSNCHKAQDGRTDVGFTDQRLISSIHYGLALTGTLFGGTAGSLFFLLYRRVPQLRKLFGFREKHAWVDKYGLWKKTWDQKDPVVIGKGASGQDRWGYKEDELPGISPAIIRYMLPITIFGNISDLGYELPTLTEHVETVQMTKEQAAQYEIIEVDYLKKVVEVARKAKDPGGLGLWFNACRFRPVSCYRPEQFAYKHYFSELMPSVTDSFERRWLPKEIKLAEIVRANMLKGRRVLIYVEQTGTRDVRDRIELALQNLVPVEGIREPRIETLSAADLSPAKREAWITSRIPYMDVMLCNPRLVETGLDLVMFSTLVFYETTVSLYTLWQALKRIYRPGQALPVEVIFLAYANTIEQTILSRMGAKKKSAQLLYGKEAQGVLVEVDNDDIQREMIENALEGIAFRSAGEQLSTVFTDGSEITSMISLSPMGSLVAVSPPLPTVDDSEEWETNSVFKQVSLFDLSIIPVIAKKKKR